MSDDKERVRKDSDELLSAISDLRELEDRKRREDYASPQFQELADEIERRANKVWELAFHEMVAGSKLEGSGDADDDSGDSIDETPGDSDD